MGAYMNGLTKEEVKINRSKYGTNVLTKNKSKTFLGLLLEACSDPIIKILLIVLAIKVIVLFRDFDWYETIGILLSIIIASFISALSEYGSDKAFSALEKSQENYQVFVIRDHNLKEITTSEIVYGDLIKLSSGNLIPADGFLIDGYLSVNESSINGEAKEKSKKFHDQLYSGTVIFDGEGIMQVSAVGDQTLIGKLAQELQVKEPISPLKKRLTKVARIISFFGYIGAFLVALIYLLTSQDFSLNNILYALTLSVTVIVVAVPEGLPMMITLVLSSNMKRLLKNNVLVRKLIGIETSGNINVLLTDKTGTLTEGKLVVTNYISPDNTSFHNLDAVNQNLVSHVINNLFLNNSCFIDEAGKICGGNQTDQAIYKFTKQSSLKVTFKKSFNSQDKYSLVTTSAGQTFIKGAPEVLLPHCLYYLNNSGEKKLLTNPKKIEQLINNYTSCGYRLIFLAESSSKKLSALTYTGLLLIKDQIRKTTKEAITTLNNAQINTIMVTGDALNTAISIAKETNIISNSQDIAITSSDFNKLSSTELINLYPHLKVIARALPQDKSRLVTILENNSLIVGMTGDGVNDAPALKKANVGFAMGSGTEVAKSAADIVILDDDIASITKAVLFGRTIFKSIRKFIIFQLTVNLCAMLMAIIGPLINISTPVTIIQMLWINMIMDTLAGIAFSYEPALVEYMNEPPKKDTEPIINAYMYGEIIFTGLYSFLIGIFFLKSSITSIIIRSSNDNRYLLTAYFALFIFTGIFNALNARTERINILANIQNNLPFIFIFSIILLIQIYLIYFGGALFRTYGLTIPELTYIIILSLSVIPFDWLRKIKSKKRFQSI